MYVICVGIFLNLKNNISFYCKIFDKIFPDTSEWRKKKMRLGESIFESSHFRIVFLNLKLNK